MTDEGRPDVGSMKGLLDRERAERIVDQVTVMLALCDGVEMGAWLGASIAVAAAIEKKTPRELYQLLIDQGILHTDEEWAERSEFGLDKGETVRAKLQEATMAYQGGQFVFTRRGGRG